MMNLGRVLASSIVVSFAVACGGGVSLGTAGGALGTGEDGGTNGGRGAEGPYDIACTTYFEPATQHLQDTFTVKSDSQGQKTISLPGYTVDAEYGGESGSPEATLSIAVRELGTVQRFRLARDKRPAQDFAGDHGFSGLVYVGPGLQYVCKASKTADTPVSTSPTPTPINVACTVEVRASAGGVLERTETIHFTSADARTIDLGDFGIRANMQDSPYEGRSMWIDLWRKPDGADHATIRQLLQFDRNVPITNAFGADFTGRIAIARPSEREVSYSCAAR